LAERAVNRLLRYLALGITNLVNILGPEIVALGGGVAAAGQQLFAPLQEAVQALVLVASLAPPPIVAA
jgi:glucokinase